MPDYTFLCDEDKDGCGHAFEVSMSMSDYNENHVCPSCKQTDSIRRCLEEDFPTLNSSVVLSDHEIKVGHLAKRNTERLSVDEKAAIHYNNNKYKYEEPTKELPGGMKRMGKPKHREFTKKQNKRDPKQKKKKNGS